MQVHMRCVSLQPLRDVSCCQLAPGSALDVHVQGRLKWVVERLEQSILDATACPVCRPDVMGAAPGMRLLDFEFAVQFEFATVCKFCAVGVLRILKEYHLVCDATLGCCMATSRRRLNDVSHARAGRNRMCRVRWQLTHDCAHADSAGDSKVSAIWCCMLLCRVAHIGARSWWQSDRAGRRLWPGSSGHAVHPPQVRAACSVAHSKSACRSLSALQLIVALNEHGAGCFSGI